MPRHTHAHPTCAVAPHCAPDQHAAPLCCALSRQVQSTPSLPAARRVSSACSLPGRQLVFHTLSARHAIMWQARGEGSPVAARRSADPTMTWRQRVPRDGAHTYDGSLLPPPPPLLRLGVRPRAARPRRRAECGRRRRRHLALEGLLLLLDRGDDALVVALAAEDALALGDDHDELLEEAVEDAVLPFGPARTRRPAFHHTSVESAAPTRR